MPPATAGRGALCSFTTGNDGSGGCTFIAKGTKNISLEITGPNVGRSDIGTFKVTDDGGGGGGGNNGGGRGGNNNQRDNNGRYPILNLLPDPVSEPSGTLVQNPVPQNPGPTIIPAVEPIPDPEPVIPDFVRDVAIDLTLEALGLRVGINLLNPCLVAPLQPECLDVFGSDPQQG